MPRKYVFPGGRVDRADSYAPLARELRGEVCDVLERVLPARRARAAAAAALRETAEETGLLLARPAPAPARAKPPWRLFQEAGLAPDAAPLSLVARAITPPGRPRRFDAFFFHADAEHVHGDRQPQPSAELEDLRWASLDEAERLDIPIITRFVLGELRAHLQRDGQAPVRCARVTRTGPKVDTL